MKAVVVKLGGSLAETGSLEAWLAIVSRARRPVVVVPGGGPFADAVRRVQADLGLSDAAAHELAILAMQQMAGVLTALSPRLVACDTLVAIRRALARRRIPVWLPARLCARDRAIPRDWSITSDGLAARLAERLRAKDLVLVKSRSAGRTASAAALARDGVVDPAFAVIVTRARLDWRIVSPGEEDRLAEALAADIGASLAPATRARGRARSTGRSIHVRPHTRRRR